MQAKGRNRNELCWCGSGLKFKKCHLGREEQPVSNPWEAVNKNRMAFHKKECWAANSGLGPCKGPIIRAHTISRGPNLSAISTNGHVLHYSGQVEDLKKNKGKLLVKSIGTKEASVFNGFCRTHDQSLFSCIENERFFGRPDQCLTIAYRTLSRELYGKDALSNLPSILSKADNGKPLPTQIAIQSMIHVLNAGNEASRREIRATHQLLTDAVANNKTGVLQSLVLKFDGKLPFMFAGAWSPFTDLFDNLIQSPDSNEMLEQIFLSSFSEDSGDFICISWRDIPEAPGKLIADQIGSLSSETQAGACLQVVVKHIENIFFNPPWFEALPKEQRALLDRLAASGIDMLGSVPDETIQTELTFGLPKVVSSSVV